MNLLQLNPPIPIETPRGRGMAAVLIDYGPEYDLLWVCFIDESRECWTFGNRDVRIQPNISLRRPANPPLSATLGAIGMKENAPFRYSAPSDSKTN